MTARSDFEIREFRRMIGVCKQCGEPWAYPGSIYCGASCSVECQMGVAPQPLSEREELEFIDNSPTEEFNREELDFLSSDRPQAMAAGGGR